MVQKVVPDNLEERFTEPKGWRWHSFKRNGRRIRFGSIFPEDSIPDAIVVCLPGLSEFGEKYYETARYLTDQNLAFWVIDWMGQGASGRYLPNYYKRHSASFDEDIADLHYFILEYIKHSSVHPDKGRIPLAMLAHSMGANIGLRYLNQYPDMFECAAFSAPMFGIAGLSRFSSASYILGYVLKMLASKSYAFGQKDWHHNIRSQPGRDEFSSDQKRGAIHGLWWNENADLRLGGVTFRWVYEALKSCNKVKKLSSSVQTPLLIAKAEHDSIVDNSSIDAVAEKLPQYTLINLEQSKHEILMETDAIRDTFLKEFYNLISQSIIQRPETLKPF